MGDDILGGIAKNDVLDYLTELSRILESIEEKHGTVQAADDYRYVRRLHSQARWQIKQIRQVLNEQEKGANIYGG